MVSSISVTVFVQVDLTKARLVIRVPRIDLILYIKILSLDSRHLLVIHRSAACPKHDVIRERRIMPCCHQYHHHCGRRIDGTRTTKVRAKRRPPEMAPKALAPVLRQRCRRIKIRELHIRTIKARILHYRHPNIFGILFIPNMSRLGCSWNFTSPCEIFLRPGCSSMVKWATDGM